MRSKACSMDDLLREFLTETNESLDTVDNQLVRFEQDPNNAKILDNIFRLVHTIKGTCGFLGLPRLEALAHAAETLMGKFRDGLPVTGQAVTLILTTIDRIKDILGKLEATESEPEGVEYRLVKNVGKLRGLNEPPIFSMEIDRVRGKRGVVISFDSRRLTDNEATIKKHAPAVISHHHI